MKNVVLALSIALAALLAAGPVLAEEAATPDKPVMKGGPTGAPSKAARTAKAAPAKGIALSPMTPVASGVNVREKTLEECALQSHLPQAVAQRSTDIVLTDGAASMKLELKIVDVHAPNGGWFSGPKWVTVEGRLLQGKTIKGSFIAKETSMASATACGMLHKVIEVLAADIVAWLANPTKDAHLGSAR